MAGRKNKRKYTLGQPHLTRRRGKAKNWRGWVDGREVSLGTSDRAEAQRRLDQLAAERRRAARATERVERATKLTELAGAYIEDCVTRHTPKTAASYGHRLLMFVEWAEQRGVVRASDVDYRLLSAYVRKRRGVDGASAATVNRQLTAIRRMMVFGRRFRMLDVEPVDREGFSELRLREPRPKPNATTFRPEQIDSLLDAADLELDEAYAKLIRFVAGSGIRIDEALHADLDDVDEGRGMLIVTPKPGWTTKGYRYRDVPISSRTAEAAKRFINLRDEHPMSDRVIWARLQQARKAAELPHLSMHDLRRAWASAVYANGASLKQVSVWLGHADVATTERYIRAFDDVSDGHQYLPR